MSNFDIQVVRLDGSGLRTVTRGAAWDLDAQWSPDGKWLSFSRMPPHPSDEHLASIWVVRFDGTGLRRVAAGFGARWSPDGRLFAYEAPRGPGVSDLSLIRVDGKASRRLASTPGVEQPANWSPDGRMVLFTRYSGDGGAAPSVLVVRADGSRVRRLGSGIAGAWSPDGRSILVSRAERSALIIMSSDGSNRRAVFIGDAQEPDWR